LAEDAIMATDLIASIGTARLVEDHPTYPKGPCILVLQSDRHGAPVHAVWGISKGADSPAVLITAYRPNPRRWSNDFLRRRS
jgi:hypothetical protein